MANSVTERIRKYYQEHHRNPYHISVVAEEINEKEDIVKVLASRLWKKNELIKVSPATYQFPKDEDKVVLKEEFDNNYIGFHGIRLVADRNLVTKKRESPTKVTSVTSGNKLLLPASPGEVLAKHIPLDHFCKTAIGPKAKQVYQIRNRQITVEVSKFTLEVTLKNSDENLTVPEFDAFLQLLEFIFYPHFYDYNWKCQTFGIAVDFYDLTIQGEGISQITLEHIHGYIQRWYEKRGIKALRRETHTRKGVPIEELIQNLRGEVPLGTVELIELVQNQQIMVTAIEKQYQEIRVKLNKLLDQISLLNRDVGEEPIILDYE